MAKQDPKKAVNERIDFLDDRETALTKKVTALENRLFRILTQKLLSKLDTDSGLIKTTSGNLKLSQALDQIFIEFNRDFNSIVVQQFRNDLFSTLELHDNYFKEFGAAKKIKSIRTKNRDIMFARLGVSERGRFIKGGFLEGFLNDTGLKNEVLNATVANISARAPKASFVNQLETLIVGAPDAAGGRLQRHYRTFAYDTYQEFDRTYGQLWAEELKMTSFLYLGGKIRTTRRFCCQRNGLVFTIEEAQQWRKLQFSGKPVTGYKPLVQLGGHNCRHSTQWLENEQALLFRKDLEIRNGKLVPKRKTSRQKLNSGCGRR